MEYDTFISDPVYDSQGNDVTIDPHAPTAADQATAAGVIGPTPTQFESFVADSGPSEPQPFQSFKSDFDTFEPDTDKGFWKTVGEKFYKTGEEFNDAAVERPGAAMGGMVMGGMVEPALQAASIVNAYVNPAERVRQAAMGEWKSALGIENPTVVAARAEKFAKSIEPPMPTPEDARAWKAGANLMSAPFTPVSEAIERIPNEEVRAAVGMGALVGGFLIGAESTVKPKIDPVHADLIKAILEQSKKGDQSFFNAQVESVSKAVEKIVPKEESVPKTADGVEEITLKPIEEQPAIELPPVAEGEVRLFRGGDVGKFSSEVGRERQGRWFSTDRDLTTTYGKVNYVDVPEEIAALANVGGDGFVLPREWAEKAVRETPEPKVTDQTALLDANTSSIMYQVATLLKTAATPEEFKTRLQSMMPDSLNSWKDFVETNAPSMWKNGESLISAYGTPNTEGMTGTRALWARHELSTQDFMEQIIKNLPKEAKGKIPFEQDIDPSMTLLLPPTQLSILKGVKTIGGMVMKFMQDQGGRVNSLEKILKAKAESHFVEYAKLTGKQQRAFMTDASYWDNAMQGRKILIEKDLQWPTREMLAERGMPEESINAYLKVTEGLDFLHDLMNQLRAKNGVQPLPQIPGYMPHVHAGAFKVSLVKTTWDKKGHKIDESVVHVQGYPTALHANIAVRAIQKKGTVYQGDRSITYSPKMDKGKPYTVQSVDEISERASQSIQEQLKAYGNQETNPDVLPIIEEIEAARYQGFTKHELERSDIPGYLGEFGAEKNNFTGYFKNKQITNLYDNYIKSVTSAYKNAVFMNDVARPIMDHMPLDKEKGTYYGDVLDNSAHLQKYLDEYTSNFTGNPVNRLKWIDDKARWSLEAVGLSPKLLRTGIADVTNLLSLAYLRVNPIYLASNSIQFMHTISVLEALNVTRRAAGEKNVPSPYETISRMIQDMPEAHPEMEAALQWAEHNHITNQPMEYELRKRGEGSLKDIPTAIQTIVHTVTAGDAAAKIENFSRELSFRLAFEHARQMHPNDHAVARTVAQQVMEMTMVNYDRTAKPLMFTNLGAIGGVLNPLATLHNAYMGNLLIQTKLAISSPARMAYLPIATALVTYGVMSGINGMPFVQDINSMLEMINDHFETNIPSIEYMLMEMGVPDAVTWGSLAEVSKNIPGFGGEGVHVGPSLAAPTAEMPLAMPGFVMGIAHIFGLGIQAAGHAVAPKMIKSGVDATEIYAAGHAVLPSSLRSYWDRAFRPEGTLIDATGTSLKGRLDATEAGDAVQNWLARRSLATMKQGVIDQFVSQEMKREDKRLKKAVETVADIMDKKITQETVDWARAVAAEQQIPVDKFNEMVYNVVEDRRTSNESREFRHPTPLNERRIALRQRLGWQHREP